MARLLGLWEFASDIENPGCVRPARMGLVLKDLLKDRHLRDLADIRVFHRVGAVDLDLNFLHD